MSSPGSFKHRPLTAASLSAEDHGPGTLYFAYGSNLSPTQMTIRCTSTPERSGQPIAIARLHGWKWFICERGCANVAYTGNVGRLEAEDGPKVDASGGDEVWGVLYNMSIEDEETLDRYEHVDWSAPEAEPSKESSNEISSDGRGFQSLLVMARPNEQGTGHHNKVYVNAEIVEWKIKGWRDQQQDLRWARVLVYVDEYRITEGAIRENYIGRMNRGIKEAVTLGLSKEWVEKVVRPQVPDGIDALEGFVGVI
ncbi:hypothetical protein LTR84_011759 [Exophiala bonariae]|uniref:gamma-glutamylcyclotransferase n=1 Tax=Exophiala bonariae TaxID=1690606 RepID=A0AAV9NKJ4_9EURO|nr:hypothetical protein LTR84_011759 [Exophiala bonariae]